MMKKFSTMFLAVALMVTVFLASGCTKEPDKPVDDKKDPDIVEKDTNKETEKGQTVKKLLTRNGIVWKENKTIKSKRGDASYVTVWGDTLKVIAKTWHVNTVKLAQYNGMKDPEKLNTGTTIYNYLLDGSNGMLPGYSADEHGN